MQREISLHLTQKSNNCSDLVTLWKPDVGYSYPYTTQHRKYFLSSLLLQVKNCIC
jgi:hypothetical protein